MKYNTRSNAELKKLVYRYKLVKQNHYI